MQAGLATLKDMTGEGDPAARASSNMVQLEWMRVRTATATYLMNSILDLERGQQIYNLMEARILAGLVGPLDTIELRASLVGRVNRSMLNHIQADELTEWGEILCRLKKAYGGGQ